MTKSERLYSDDQVRKEDVISGMAHMYDDQGQGGTSSGQVPVADSAELAGWLAD